MVIGGKVLDFMILDLKCVGNTPIRSMILELDDKNFISLLWLGGSYIHSTQKSKIQYRIVKKEHETFEL